VALLAMFAMTVLLLVIHPLGSRARHVGRQLHVAVSDVFTLECVHCAGDRRENVGIEGLALVALVMAVSSSRST
jgi:hypothetical protein